LEHDSSVYEIPISWILSYCPFHGRDHRASDTRVGIAWASQRAILRIIHRPVQLLEQDRSCPFPCIFLLGLLCTSGFPLAVHALAAPATKLRVSPPLQSIHCAGDGFSSRLESRILPRRWFK